MEILDKEAKDKKFTGIYNCYYSEILSYVTFKMNNSLVSEEITSDVFLKVYNKLDTFDNTKGKFTTWLHTVANNTIIDFYRSNKEIKNVSISNFVYDNGNDRETLDFQADYNDVNDIESKELTNSITKAFKGLKPKYQKIATLLFLEQKKYDEIAEICEIPIGSVKGMINRCRAMLQTQLQNQKIEYSIG